VRGPWNEAFIDEFCAFNPDVKDQVDDQIDATSRWFTALTGGQTAGVATNQSGRRRSAA
jgi:phage terminase large subunit-like protein